MILILLISFYSICGLLGARIVARSLYYEQSKSHNWDELWFSLLAGLLLGAIWPLWAIPLSIHTALKRVTQNNPDILARAFFGEPAPIRNHRLLEEKVDLKRKTKELEKWLEHNEV